MKLALIACAVFAASGNAMPMAAMLGSGLRASAPDAKEVVNTVEYVEKLGDNLPYPGSDVLGLGYDLILGNPAGDPDTRTLLWGLPFLCVFLHFVMVNLSSFVL